MARAVTKDAGGRAGFAPSTGWNLVGSTFAWGDGVGQVAFASNAAVVGDDATTGWPINTVRQLPSSGIVICVSLLPHVEGGSLVYPDRSLPLRLADGIFLTGQYEDQAAPNVSVYRLATQMDAQYATIEVFFGTPSPDGRMLRAAEEQLANFAVAQGVGA
jgi:hypothetical protein